MVSNVVRVFLLCGLGMLSFSGAGCQSSRGGGVSAGEGFKFNTPPTMTLKQGEVQSVELTVVREERFKRDVTVDIRATRGLEVTPTRVLLTAAGVPTVNMRIAASRNAAIGEHRVFIEGTPATGEATSTEFVVQVVNP